MANVQIIPGYISNIAPYIEGVGASTLLTTSGDGTVVSFMSENGFEIRIGGTDLDAGDADARWVSGTVTSVTVVNPYKIGGEEILLTIDGLSLDLSDLGAVIDAGEAQAVDQFLFAGNDSITGTEGNDRFYASLGTDTFEGGEGHDVVDFSHIDTSSFDIGVEVDLMNERGTNVDGSELSLVGIEGVTGTDLGDYFYGSDGANEVYAAGGDDFLEGFGGNDGLTGGDGNDTMIGGEGDDVILGGAGIDTAMFMYDIRDYTFTFDEYGFLTVSHQAEENNEGTDTLGEVEFLEFGGVQYAIETFLPVTVANQTSAEDAAWSFKLPAGFDTDSFVVTSLDGSPLPSWIGFDADTQTFSGTPPQDYNGTIGIKVVGDIMGYLKTSTFSLTVSSVNDVPVIAALSANKVEENSSSGTVVGHLSAIDPDLGDSATYRLVDSAGGRFKIAGNAVMVADGSKIDYEQATSHTITVEVTDKFGGSSTKSFTVDVTDVANETVSGTLGNDVVKGGSGNDKIGGGLGKDVLTGGKGKDSFVFNTKASKANVDKITDFNVKDDSIHLDNKYFAKLGSKGSEKSPAKLKKEFFTIGSKAKDKNDYLVYDNKKGILYYDADGSGSKYKQVEVATLSKNLKMTYADFFVI